MNEIFLEGTIELILSILLVGLVVFKLNTSLRRHRKVWVLSSVALSLVSITISVVVFLGVLDVAYSAVWVRMVRGIVSGYLPGVIFIFVMFAGALKKDHPWKKTLMGVRTELSVVGFILYLPHTLLYTAFSAPYGIANLFSGDIRLFSQLMTWTGLTNSILLILLGITSFRGIRQRMKATTWIRIQKWAYLFYFNCFVHYMTLSIYGGHYERAVLYTLIYGSYLCMKVKKELADHYSKIVRVA